MAWTFELLQRLSDAQIPFVVIGGVAAIAHGSARITEDLDLCAPLHEENARAIIRALADAHPIWHTRPDLPVVAPDSHHLSGGLNNMYLRTDLGRLDVLGEIPGIGKYEDILGRTVEMEFRGRRVRVLDLDTLIASKQFASRHKDHPTVRELETIRETMRKRKDDQPELF